MTQGTPGGNADDNETVAFRRGDLSPGSFGGAQQPQSYGQSPQGQPYGAPTPPFHPSTATGRSLGTTALILALLGAVAAAVGLFAVRWTKVTDTPGVSEGAKFLDLRKLFVTLDDAGIADKPTFTITYFNWAAFVLLGAALVFAILSALPTSATPAFRVLGFVIGLVSAAAAPFVPLLDGADDLSAYLKGGLGLYLVAVGSLLIAIGALIGSRRRG